MASLPEAEVVALLDGLAVCVYSHTPPWNAYGEVMWDWPKPSLDNLTLASFLKAPWPDIVNHHINKLARLMEPSS